MDVYSDLPPKSMVIVGFAAPIPMPHPIKSPLPNLGLQTSPSSQELHQRGPGHRPPFEPGAGKQLGLWDVFFLFTNAKCFSTSIYCFFLFSKGWSSLQIILQ